MPETTEKTSLKDAIAAAITQLESIQTGTPLDQECIAHAATLHNAALRELSPWISASDRLPEWNEIVIVVNSCQEVGMACVENDQWIDLNGQLLPHNRGIHTTHWMPLPEAPNS